MPLMPDQNSNEESLLPVSSPKKYNFRKVNPTLKDLEEEDQARENLNGELNEQISTPVISEQASPVLPPKKYNFRKVNPTLKDLEEEDESYIGTAGRNIIRGGARALESVAGFPGDLYQTGKSLVGGAGNLLEKAIPKPIKEAASSVKKNLESYLPEGTSLTDISKRALPGLGMVESIAESLPTSQSLKEKTIKAGEAIGLPDKYLEAQTPEEETSDSYIRDVVSFMLPGAGKLKTGAAIGRALKGSALFSAIPNLVSYANKKITGNDILGEGLKLGTMLVQTLYGIKPIDLENFGNGLAKKASSALKGNQKENSTNVLNAFRKVNNNYVQSGNENLTSKKAVGEFLQAGFKKGITPGKPARYSEPVFSKIVDPQGNPFQIGKRKLISAERLPVEEMSIKDMWELKKDVWPTLREIKGKDKRAAKLLKSLGATLDKTLKNTSNKKFNELYKESNAVLTGFHKIEEVLDYTKEVLGGKGTGLAKTYAFLTDPFKTIRNSLLAQGLKTSFNKSQEAKILLEVFQKSPKLKSAYAGIFKSAANKNSAALVRQALTFENTLKEEAEAYAKKQKRRIKR